MGVVIEKGRECWRKMGEAGEGRERGRRGGEGVGHEGAGSGREG